MNIDLIYPANFLLACDLYYEQPERVIQYFLDGISLPDFYAGKDKMEMLHATSFFLEFESRPNKRPYPAIEVRERYLDYETVVLDTVEQFEEMEDKVEVLKSFYQEWHFELIKNISKNDAIINQAERKKLFRYRFK